MNLPGGKAAAVIAIPLVVLLLGCCAIVIVSLVAIASVSQS
jgi:hypothetical protein